MAKKTQKNTKGSGYTKILEDSSNNKLKTFLDVQRPYRWNLKRLNLGKTLDVGCGIGRNLANLSSDSVGVDHNKHSILAAQAKGLNAFTSEDFFNMGKFKKNAFDSMILTHVLEHLTTEDGAGIIKEYLPFIKSKVVVICPQEVGFKSDDTHINFLKHADIELILEDLGLNIKRSYSFPFPRHIGKIFQYNETVVVAEK